MGEPYHWYDSPTSTLQVVELATGTPPLEQGVWLSGHGAPPAGSGLLPLDGVNDPWRWYARRGAWFSPAYSVSVAADAVLLCEDIPAPPAGCAEMDVTAIVATDIAHDIGDDVTLFGDEAGGHLQSATAMLHQAPGAMTYVSLGAASGIAFLAQYEADFGGPTACPDPSIDALTVLTGLGAFTIGEPFEFSETTPIGLPGQFYLDVDTRDVYLRDATTWTKITTLPAPA